MERARRGPLTPAEKERLRQASQTIRYAKRSTAKSNAVRTKKRAGTVARARGTARTRNPGKAVLIYKDITRIEGTKGRDSAFPGQKFFHNFKRPYPSMFGLPDGSLLIRGKK